MPFLLSKLISGNKIFSGKVNESSLHIILKSSFVEKIDNNNANFELAFYIYVFSTRDNLTHRLVMGRNVVRLLDKQRLLGTKLIKKKQLDE